MVRYLFFSLLILTCCSSIKNENGRTRYELNDFSFKPNESIIVYSIIDTSSFYKLELSEELIRSRKNRQIDLEIIEGLKFYKNNRVAYFRNIKLDSINTFNPKNAIMGLYQISNGNIEFEFIVRNPQSGKYLWNERVINNSKDNNYLKVIVFNNKDTVKYSKISIPKEFLIYKPDW